jgi:hypothetical protein
MQQLRTCCWQAAGTLQAAPAGPLCCGPADCPAPHQQDGCLHHLLPAAARRLQDGAQVLHHLLRLRLNAVARKVFSAGDQALCGWVGGWGGVWGGGGLTGQAAAAGAAAGSKLQRQCRALLVARLEPACRCWWHTSRCFAPALAGRGDARVQAPQPLQERGCLPPQTIQAGRHIPHPAPTT